MHEPPMKNEGPKSGQAAETPHRRDYNAAELALIRAGRLNEAKIAWINRKFGR